MCKKLIENSQPFGKNFQKTLGGIFFDSHCRYKGVAQSFGECIFSSQSVCAMPLTPGLSCLSDIIFPFHRIYCWANGTHHKKLKRYFI